MRTKKQREIRKERNRINAENEKNEKDRVDFLRKELFEKYRDVLQSTSVLTVLKALESSEKFEFPDGYDEFCKELRAINSTR